MKVGDFVMFRNYSSGECHSFFFGTISKAREADVIITRIDGSRGFHRDRRYCTLAINPHDPVHEVNAILDPTPENTFLAVLPAAAQRNNMFVYGVVRNPRSLDVYFTCKESKHKPLTRCKIKPSRMKEWHGSTASAAAYLINISRWDIV